MGEEVHTNARCRLRRISSCTSSLKKNNYWHTLMKLRQAHMKLASVSSSMNPHIPVKVSGSFYSQRGEKQKEWCLGHLQAHMLLGCVRCISAAFAPAVVTITTFRMSSYPICCHGPGHQGHSQQADTPTSAVAGNAAVKVGATWQQLAQA